MGQGQGQEAMHSGGSRPWHPIPIAESDEPLLPLPADLLRLEPHPYQALGAPYGKGASPFQLRQGVIERLLTAQRLLQQERHGWRLAIFDGWRPVAVQRFMVEHTFASECRRLGVDQDQPSAERDQVIEAVERLWAPPSEDPATPPPHSTGAAVDLTLIDQGGQTAAMGSAIDAIGAIAEPDHPGRLALTLPPGEERQQMLRHQQHRDLLQRAMTGAGFAQHPGEWWHFSWGDQLWAWRCGAPAAIYGRWSERSTA